MARSVSHDRGGRTVLSDVSLTVGPQACVGVTGPNGVGKTTLLRLLAGLEPPDGGTVHRRSARMRPWATSPRSTNGCRGRRSVGT